MPNTFMGNPSRCGCNSCNCNMSSYLPSSQIDYTYNTNIPYYNYNMPSNYYTSNMTPYQYRRLPGESDRLFGLFPFALGLGAGGLLFGPRFYPPYPVYPPVYQPAPYFY